MPKYNLIDDLESEENKPKSAEESIEKSDSTGDTDDTKLSDYIVEDIVISEPEMKGDEEIVLDAGDAAPDDFTDQQKFTVPEGTPPMQPYDLGSEYEDEKQPGINFKPILIGIGILAAIAIIYFAVDAFFLNGDTEPETAVVTETPEQKMQRVREEQKQNLLLSHSNSNKQRLAYISTLMDIKASDVTYSSFLLYGNSLDFEVFAKNRDQLAQFNLLLKNNDQVKNYSIESAVTRPGSKGGVFALYTLVMASASGGGSGAVTSTTPSNWVAASTSQFGLGLTSQRQISTRTDNMFSVSRNEFVFEGSEENCSRLVKQMASQSTNLSAHKLMLLPRDQRLMSKSAYELRLTLDFYL